MSNFLGWFFRVLGGKINLKKNFKNFSNRIDKLHKMAFTISFFIEKVWKKMDISLLLLCNDWLIKFGTSKNDDI